MYKLTLSLCLLLLATGCTVEKRVYRPGWHVEWHHRSARSPDAVTDASLRSPSTAPAPPANKLRPAPGDTAFTNDSMVAPEQTVVAAFTSPPPDSLPKQAAQNNHANHQSVHRRTTPIAQPPLQRKIIVIPPRETANERLQTDTLVVVMWVLDALLIAAILLSLFLLFFFGGWEMVLALLLLIGVPFFLIVNAVLGIFVMQHRKSSDYPYRDSALVYPIFGAVFAVLALFLAAFIAIIILVFTVAG